MGDLEGAACHFGSANHAPPAEGQAGKGLELLTFLANDYTDVVQDSDASSCPASYVHHCFAVCLGGAS